MLQIFTNLTHKTQLPVSTAVSDITTTPLELAVQV